MTIRKAIIIGGGIAGTSAAYALAKRGMQVTLYERNQTIAAEASGNPLAMLYPRLSGENSISMFNLAAYQFSLDFYQSLQLSKAELHHCGMLQLGFNTRELQRIEKVAKYLPQHIAQLVNSQTASHIANIKLHHAALYFPQAAWILPVNLCQILTAQDNIECKTSININKILKENNYFKVYADNQLIDQSEIVIIANANSAQKFAQLSHLTTRAVRGQVSLLNATPESNQLKCIICSDAYFSPCVQHQHSLGATFSQTENDEVMQEDHILNLASLREISTELFNALQIHVNAGRVAFRCSSSDYLPLVGAVLDHEAFNQKPPRPSAASHTLPWLTGLYVSLGHGSRGFSSAPFCAELLASMICNTPLPMDASLAGLLNPNRFLLRELGLKRLAKLPSTPHI